MTYRLAKIGAGWATSSGEVVWVWVTGPDELAHEAEQEAMHQWFGARQWWVPRYIDELKMRSLGFRRERGDRVVCFPTVVPVSPGPVSPGVVMSDVLMVTKWEPTAWLCEWAEANGLTLYRPPHGYGSAR